MPVLMQNILVLVWARHQTKILFYFNKNIVYGPAKRIELKDEKENIFSIKTILIKTSILWVENFFSVRVIMDNCTQI